MKRALAQYVAMCARRTNDLALANTRSKCPAPVPLRLARLLAKRNYVQRARLSIWAILAAIQ